MSVTSEKGERSKAALRIAVQFVLVLPVLVFWPIALFLGLSALLLLPGAVADLSSGVYRGVTFGSFAFFAAVYGLLVLPLSILVPTRLAQRWRWLRIVLSTLLVGGCLDAIALLTELRPDDPPKRLLLGLWVFGGPVLVAIWNIARFFGWGRNARGPVDSAVARHKSTGV